MNKTKKEIGNLEERQAIDLTPIYFIKLNKGVRAGETLRIDMADKKVFISKNVSSS